MLENNDDIDDDKDNNNVLCMMHVYVCLEISLVHQILQLLHDMRAPSTSCCVS